MPNKFNWQHCIEHQDEEVKSFLKQHFSESHRKCLVVAGAGFDPRATSIPVLLSEVLGDRLKAFFIKEERPDPDQELLKRAQCNLEELQQKCILNEVHTIEIFSDDSAVVGGHNLIHRMRSADLGGVTDIVVDLSALSVGISFPAVKFVSEFSKQNKNINVHLVVESNPELDSLISSFPNDRVSRVRGFAGEQLQGEGEKAVLWLPQLSGEKHKVLSLIYDHIQPHDTCPVLPFPSEEPKKGDKLAIQFVSQIENEWSVDSNNFVYADERSPLGLYRTILRIESERAPVFESFGGSVVYLSPSGSKMLAVGALLAALEKGFPVVYVEALQYTVDWESVDRLPEHGSRYSHIWLYGEAYSGDIN